MTDQIPQGRRASDREASLIMKWLPHGLAVGGLLVSLGVFKAESDQQGRINDQQDAAISAMAAQQAAITVTLTQLTGRVDGVAADGRRLEITIDKLDVILRAMDNKLGRIEERLGTRGGPR